MTHQFSAQRLDIAAFAHAVAFLSGDLPLTELPRLAQEAAQEVAQETAQEAASSVAWSAQGELRFPNDPQPQCWLILSAKVTLPMTCQRCLSPAPIEVEVVQRPFRFVQDEKTAEELDGECEEDLLVLSPAFNLVELIEDELIMALPLVPKHESCTAAVPLGAPPAPNPFAALASLKKG